MHKEINRTALSKSVRINFTGIRRNWKRASFTVEAAFLIPWATILVALVLTLLFYEHNRVWYTAAACETALVGIAADDESRMSEMRERAQMRIEEEPFPGKAPRVELTASDDQCGVSYSGRLAACFQHVLGEMKTGTDIKKVRPVGVLYHKHNLANIGGRICR